MRSKTYRAKTMKEALTRVRRDLGGDAVILAAREVRRRRLFGLGPATLVEVTATDSCVASRRREPARRPALAPVRHRAPAVDSAHGPSPALQARFGEELSRLHAMVETLSRQGRIDHLLPDVPAELVPIYSQIDRGGRPRGPDPPAGPARRRGLEPDSSTRPRRSAQPCARPSSSASRSRRRSRRSPGRGGWSPWWVRPASARPRRSPSSRPISSWPTACGSGWSPSTPTGSRRSSSSRPMPRSSTCRWPWSTTPPRCRGRSTSWAPSTWCSSTPRAAARATRSRSASWPSSCCQAQPDEVHLVLSAVAGQRSLRAAVERFAMVHVDRLILTKLDEADSLGGVLGVLGMSSRPVSYLTTGQAVPDDIEPADRKRLARLILRQEDLW